MLRIIFLILSIISLNAYSFDPSIFKKEDNAIPSQEDALRPVDLSTSENLVISFEPNSGGRLYYKDLKLKIGNKEAHFSKFDSLKKSKEYLIKHDDYFGKTKVYDDPVKFKISLKDVADRFGDLKSGEEIEISYRGCLKDHGVCYPHGYITHVVEKKIKSNNKISPQSSEDINLSLLFASFVLGITLSLTPCLYAMIPITLTTLKSKSLNSALLYFMGILSSYYLMGVLIRTNSLELQRVFQNPYVYIFMGLILLISGLHYLKQIKLFFWAEVLLSSLNKPVNKLIKTTEAHGNAGLFGLGFLSVFILSSCSIPITLSGLGLIGSHGIDKAPLYLLAFGVGSIIILIAGYIAESFLLSVSGQLSKYFKFALSGLLIISGTYLIYESSSNLHSDNDYRFNYTKVISREDLNDGYLIVTSKNCYFCNKMANETYSNEAIIRKLNNENVLLLDLTQTSKEKEKILKELEIISYPVLIKISDGVMRKHYGFLSGDEVLDIIKKG